MGYAKILSGGPDGRYTIELDFGAERKAAELSAANAMLAQLEIALGAVLEKLAEADAKEFAQLLAVKAAQSTFFEDVEALPPGSPFPSAAAITFEVGKLNTLKVAHAPIRLQRTAIAAQRSATFKSVAYWNQFQATEVRPAWCVDLTEDGPIGLLTATAELPGDSRLVLIKPGVRAARQDDGFLQAREVMSPAQAYFNTAILPGWQKFKPTHRWGTATAIDYDADTMDVELAPQTSTPLRLDVNLITDLQRVPVTYMECNAAAFSVGDRVVVEFEDQDWEKPSVIGFLDNPKACPLWPPVLVDYTQYGLEVVSAGSGTAVWAYAYTIEESCTVRDFWPSFEQAHPKSNTVRRYTRRDNYRFEPENTPDSFQIVSVPYESDWGLSQEASVLLGSQDASAVAPSSSPVRTLLKSGNTVSERIISFGPRTNIELDPTNDCELIREYEVNFWDGATVGQSTADVFAANPGTPIPGDTAPPFFLEVRRGTRTRLYSLTDDLSPASMETEVKVLRYSVIP